MAKADAKEYFLTIERQYKEIKELLDDVNEYYQKGEMSEEAAKDALADFERAQLVYDTARIFMHHLNKRKNNKNSEPVDLPDNFMNTDKGE